jgi:hypothetical protein
MPDVPGDPSQHLLQRVASGCDGKPRQGDTFDRDGLLAWFWQACGVRIQIDDQGDDGRRLIRYLPDAGTTFLDQSGEFRHRLCE